MAKNETGWGGVFSIYPMRKLGKGCIIPALILIFSIVLYVQSKTVDSISLLESISGIIVSGYPSIIGFVLTGYALIIGFSSSELFGKMARITVDEKHSYFQVVSSIFAVVLFIVVTTYIVACIVTYVIKLNIEWPLDIISSTQFNTVCLFVFLFLFYYSVFSLIDVIVNIFNIGQYANAVAQNKKEDNLEDLSIFERILRFIFRW